MSAWQVRDRERSESDSPQASFALCLVLSAAFGWLQMSDFSTVSVSVIPEVTEVRLYDDTIEHVRTRHPEVPALLPSVEFAVFDTLRNPTHVEKSYESSYVFVNARATNRSGDPLRVPVKIVSGTSARVKSFYFATPSTKPTIVWRTANR
jgi:hypothetical protein